MNATTFPQEIRMMSLEDLRTLFYECLSDFQQKQEARKQNEGEKLLSTNEVMKALGVTRSTLWRWMKNEYLVPTKVGHKNNFYKKSDVDKLL